QPAIVRLQHSAQVLRVHLLRMGGEADEVGEEDGDDATLLERALDPCGDERRAALAAELVSGRVLGAARRADEAQARAAGAAERLSGRVFLSTREADLGFGHERTSFECKHLHRGPMTRIAPTIGGVTTLEYE